MSRTIHIAAELDAPPAEVFDTYLDARRHAAITGAPASVAARVGAPFVAFDKALSGRILHLVPKSLIVQSWRASQWKSSDADSILVLSLQPIGRARTRVELVHVNVPDHDFAGVSQGWEIYYWAPWRAYLKSLRPLRARRASARRG